MSLPAQQDFVMLIQSRSCRAATHQLLGHKHLSERPSIFEIKENL